MKVFVARQPIFDRGQAVYAYELLFRSGLANYYDALDANRATEDVIANSFFVIGFDELTDGKRAFINFPRRLLVEGVAALLPPDVVAIEILEDVEPDEEVVSACSQLKKDGFMMAMDDFVYADRNNPLIDCADIVKVDFMATSPDERKTLCEDLTARGVEVLAEKVETAEEFKEALDWGYSYFQGYFFAKPVVKTGRSITGNQLTYLQALSKVNQPDISYDELDEVIKQDASLTYKLLRFINSAWFGLRCEIHSIRHALVLLGSNEIKKWFSMIALRGMSEDKPQELIYRMAVRAKMAEEMAPLVDMEDCASQLFLLGMFSMIDALVDLSMKDVLDKLPFDGEIKRTLLGAKTRFSPVLDVIVAYESANWKAFAGRAKDLGLEEGLVPDVYTGALKWANDAFATM